MTIPFLRPPASRLALLAPPYNRFDAITFDWRPDSHPPLGKALIWWLVDGKEQEGEFVWLHDRCPGLPLFIVLPPASELARAMPLLSYVNALLPKAVLPTSTIVAPVYLRRLLASPPRDLASAVTQYLAHRGLLQDATIREEVDNMFRHVPDIASVSKLARRLYTSRRTLGRHFAAAGLPVPSHWLQFARLLFAIVRLQSDKATVSRVASRAGYPDGFTLSNQMKRLIGHRPTEVRAYLGWEWVVEAWIRREVANGGIDRHRYSEVTLAYWQDPEAPRS